MILLFLRLISKIVRLPIFCDDNNRKPICRLYFNTSNKSIGIFACDKNETKHKISSLDEIYDYQEELKQAIQKYL